MKKTFFISLFILISGSIFAQELPFSQQYLFNLSLINPSIASRDNYLAIRFTDRHQWLGITDAPTQQSISVNNKFTGKMGGGVNFYNEIYGPIRNSGLQLSYFYDIKLGADRVGSKLSLGVCVAGFQKVLDETDLETLEPDNIITNTRESAFYPNAGLGAFYYNKFLSAGFSIANLIPSQAPIYSESEPAKIRTYFLYTDYTYSNEINTFAVIPSILLKVNENTRREVNVNTKVYFRNFLWLGVSYRDALETGVYKNQSVAGLIGLRLFDMVYLGYSYDIELSSFQSYNAASHEIMLGGNIYTKKQGMPRYF